MTKFMCMIAALMVVAAGAAGFASRADSQAAVPQADPLLVACAVAADAAPVGEKVIYCRQAAPTVVSGLHAEVFLRVKLQTLGVYNIRVRLYQSAWINTAFDAEPA